MQDWAPFVDMLEEMIHKLVAKVMIRELRLRAHRGRRRRGRVGFGKVQGRRLHRRVRLVVKISRGGGNAWHSSIVHAVGWNMGLKGIAAVRDGGSSAV